MMHSLQTCFILAYHGCLEENAETILKNNCFVASTEDYDWLGHGIYFWEASPLRAWQWAKDKAENKGGEPAVLGAVIDLGLCLDTMTLEGCQELGIAYKGYVNFQKVAELSLPINEPERRHFLDCDVINFLHEIREFAKKQSIDTVRGIFHEGKQLYQGAMFYEKTHSQICVRSQDSIKGIFRVRPDEET